MCKSKRDSVPASSGMIFFLNHETRGWAGRGRGSFFINGGGTGCFNFFAGIMCGFNLIKKDSLQALQRTRVGREILLLSSLTEFEQ